MTLLEKSLHTIELPKVLEMLAAEAVSEKAKEKCRQTEPKNTLYECQTLQQQTADAVYLMGMQGSPSFGGLKDISASLERAEKGGLLNPSELLQVMFLLRAARITRAYREEKKEVKTGLDGYFSMLAGNKYLEDRIGEAIISEEEISDNASSELYQIRRQMRAASSKVREVLSKITSSQSYSKMLQDSIVTQRNGRFVVPVKAEYRGSFPGLVHDVSASGATLFVEPSSVVELNNSMRVLAGKEKAEIERILAELSAEAASFSSSIQRDYETLCQLDYIFARGKLAYKMKAVRPNLKESGRCEIRKGRHPLLPQDTAVPISFSIGGSTDTVIITGPNTGGKTVSIKTLGLLTAMAQCGLQIPASEESSIVIYKKILADIGDEQSIEQSLSTFSSHMKNIVQILSQAGEGCLVLLDELGAGTDPVEGAALAMAIIEHLRKVGANVAATTHYAELKVYALETPGVENASCEFDVQSLKPTYKLIFGVPGKSNAFAISRRLGLGEDIIEAAGRSVSAENRRLEEVITGLEEKRQALEQSLERARREQSAAEEKREEAARRLDSLERDREKIVMEAKLKAQEIIKEARQSSDQVLQEAKKLRQEAQEGKDANLAAARAAFRGQLSEAEKKVMAQRAKRKPLPLHRDLQIGDTVEIVATNTRGTVIEKPDKEGNLKIQAGILKITVNKSEIQLVENAKPAPAPAKKRAYHPSLGEGVSPSLDIRGQNGDEAVLEIDRYLDNAYRRHLDTVTIIHGKGTGALRQRVHAHLKNHPQVKSFRLGVFGEGETGVTIVTLKK